MMASRDFANTDSGQRRSTPLTITAVAVALIGLGAHSAHAQIAASQPATSQPAPPPSLFAGIEVLVNPYVWIPWTNVSVRPADTRISSTSTTIDPGQLYGHLTWVPFMGSVEFRDGPYGLVVDYIHAPLKAGVSTRNIFSAEQQTA